jgi:hypothetical protein
MSRFLTARAFGAIVIAMLGFLVSSCDPFHKKKCEWYLVPDLDFRELVEPGWVSLCAVNYTIKRRKCLFTAPLKFSEDMFGKKFKLAELDYEEGRNLRKIKTVKLCD